MKLFPQVITKILAHSLTTLHTRKLFHASAIPTHRASLQLRMALLRLLDRVYHPLASKRLGQLGIVAVRSKRLSLSPPFHRKNRITFSLRGPSQGEIAPWFAVCSHRPGLTSERRESARLMRFRSATLAQLGEGGHGDFHHAGSPSFLNLQPPSCVLIFRLNAF